MVMEKVLDPDLISERISKTINLAEDGAKKAAADWQEADYFVFCGAGPNYGSACYSAAKILEASGTAAFGQDLEEWAHLQYFDRNQKVPTIVLSADGWDGDRVAEIVVAAETVGCDAALIAPSGSSMINKVGQVRILQVDGPINEAISPLFTTIPGMLLAAYHSQYMGEKYFRGFGGGRSLEGGGGISRIQSSHRQTTLRR
jgi:glucosamine--fructose-6-phosphate aminotransferase (isomerizing)